MSIYLGKLEIGMNCCSVACVSARCSNENHKAISALTTGRDNGVSDTGLGELGVL